MRCFETSVLKSRQTKLYHSYYKYQEPYQGYRKNIHRSEMVDGMFHKIAIWNFQN